MSSDLGDAHHRGDPPATLTDADRARLRPTVDTRAFERFLAAIPDDDRDGVRRAAVLHFSREVTMADVRDFFAAIGNEEVAAAMDRAAATSESDDREPEVHRETESGAHLGAVNPTKEPIFAMEPPESPQLRELWDAIEPSAPAPPTSG